MTLRPLAHLNQTSRQFGKIWHNVDIFRQAKGTDLPNWPSWCFLPMAAWVAIGSEGAEFGSVEMLQAASDASRLAAIGTWRYTQGIYRFDEDITKALTDTRLDGKIPADLLLGLPEWCVYVGTPRQEWCGATLYGFWAQVEHDINDARPELRFLLDTEKGLIPQILHIGPWTLDEAISRWAREAEKEAMQMGLMFSSGRAEFVRSCTLAIQPLLSMVLYLCSEEPELKDRNSPDHGVCLPKAKRTKKGWRLFPPAKPRIWSVGQHTGDILRRGCDKQAVERNLRPHLRRAHWHGYWSGPRDGARKFSFKWLPPVVVGWKFYEEEISTP